MNVHHFFSGMDTNAELQDAEKINVRFSDEKDLDSIDSDEPFPMITRVEPDEKIRERLSRLQMMGPGLESVTEHESKREERRKVIRFATEPIQKSVKRGKGSEEEDSTKFMLLPSRFDARKKLKRSLRSCLMERRRPKKTITKRVRFFEKGDSSMGDSQGSPELSPVGMISPHGNRMLKKRASILRTRKKRFKECHARSNSPSTTLESLSLSSGNKKNLLETKEKPHVNTTNPSTFHRKIHPTMHSPPAHKVGGRPNRDEENGILRIPGVTSRPSLSFMDRIHGDNTWQHQMDETTSSALGFGFGSGSKDNTKGLTEDCSIGDANPFSVNMMS
mmetsp:Transcript_6045/g.8384  ORF Transcript_6045/g.8384 Transcript_6045/m.8384 type:complete len:333 (-) Transcript_6045:336-1334(-)